MVEEAASGVHVWCGSLALFVVFVRTCDTDTTYYYCSCDICMCLVITNAGLFLDANAAAAAQQREYYSHAEQVMYANSRAKDTQLLFDLPCVSIFSSEARAGPVCSSFILILF